MAGCKSLEHLIDSVLKIIFHTKRFHQDLGFFPHALQTAVKPYDLLFFLAEDVLCSQYTEEKELTKQLLGFPFGLPLLYNRNVATQ